MHVLTRNGSTLFETQASLCVILTFVDETILPLESTPPDIQRRIDAGEQIVLIDVREPEEFAITRIEGATLIPMRNIPANLQQLEAKADEHVDRLLPSRNAQLERCALTAGTRRVHLAEHGRRH